MRAQQNAPGLWLAEFPRLKPDGHKYDRGHALIRGGVMTGATRLAARAAQRMGAGLVTLAADKEHYSIYAQSLESVITVRADDLKDWTQLLSNAKYNAFLLGPGLGIGRIEADEVLSVLDTRKPCVLDADALTNCAAQPDRLFSKLHDQCVLTPHEGEFDRLFGHRIDKSLEKSEKAMRATELATCTLLLKGAETIIAQPGRTPVINNNAPPWLATAGAGDVLAGMILGLLTQNMPVFTATMAAAWLHGQIATSFGRGLIAEDLVAGIPTALTDLATRV